MKNPLICTILFSVSYLANAKYINNTYAEPTVVNSNYPVTPQPTSNYSAHVESKTEEPLPDCLNNHPLCCQATESEGQKCPLQLCRLPLCQPEESYPEESNLRRQEGEECGSCSSNPYGDCGLCDDGLECARDLEDAYMPDAPAKCKNSSYGIAETYPSVPPKIENLGKEDPINPETVGNIKNDPKYQWKEQTGRKYNKCFKRFETKFKDKCEEYEDTHCSTQHEEHCDTMTMQNCALVPKETHDRKCETVNEQICHLRKSYKSEQVLDYEPKQKCHKTTKRICDTIWQFNHETTDDFLCKEITTPRCTEEWTVLYDKTCKTTYRFDCRANGPSSGYGNWNVDTLHQVHRYGNEPYNNAGLNYGQSNRNKHLDKFRCRKTPIHRCYRTPRKVKIHKCEQVKEQKCQKVTNKNPKPVQHQSCHDEPYEECEVESQHQPKIIQIPVYTEDCKNVPRQICDNQGRTTLEVKCVDELKPICKWKPKEQKCEKTPRKHCYKLPYQEESTDCDESYQEQLGGHENYGPGGYERENNYRHPPNGGYMG